MDVNKDTETKSNVKAEMESSDEWFILNDDDLEETTADENGNGRKSDERESTTTTSNNADEIKSVDKQTEVSKENHSDTEIIDDAGGERVDLDSFNLSSSYHRSSSSEFVIPTIDVQKEERNEQTNVNNQSDTNERESQENVQLADDGHEDDGNEDDDDDDEKKDEASMKEEAKENAQLLTVKNISNLHEDISDISNYSYKDVDISPGVRAYKHVPNNMVNVKLNLFLAFTVTAVIFLGVGNYIGWTDNVSHQNKVTMEQVNKLKHLQDELIVCMENEAKHISDKENINVCYKNSDYWKERFETILNESKPLKDLLEKTQKNLYSNDDDEKKNLFNDDCFVLKANQEFNKLKLYLIVKQMEHLQLLKSYEDIRNKEEISKQTLSKLKEENEDLKAKLKEEEEDDKLIEATMEERISILEKDNEILRLRLNKEKEEERLINDLQAKIVFLIDENDELKSALKQLEYQMNVGKQRSVIEKEVSANAQYDVDDDEEHEEEINLDYNYKNNEHEKNPFVLFTVEKNSDTDQLESSEQNKNNLRIDQLRQKINQIMNENDDLKSIIARLRWSEPAEEKDEIDSVELQAQLKQMNDLLVKEQDETKKWKALYEEMIKKQDEIEAIKSDENNDININNDNNDANAESYASSEEEESGEKSSEETVDGENSEENVNSFQSWFANINLTKLSDDFISNSGILGNLLNDLLQRATESNIAIPEQMYNLINSTQVAINDLQFQLINKWKELDKLKDTIELTSSKLSKKMSETLIASMRKLQNAAEKFKNNNQKPFETRFSKLSNKIVKIKDWLDIKWNTIRDKYSKQTNNNNNNDNGNTGSTNGNANVDKTMNNEQQKWYPKREQMNLINEQNDNWLIERARERELQRLHVESETLDENWYLKKSKLKFENNYEKSKKKKIKS